MLAGTTQDEPRARGVLAAALVAAVVPQLWFRSTTLIATGESFPELRGLAGVTRFWGDQYSGAGSTGVPSARLLERGIVEIVDALGGPAWLAQRIWFSLVFVVLAVSVAWMAAGILRRPSAVFAAGVVATLSPFTVVTVPNLQPAIAIGAVGLLVGIIVRLADRRHVPAALGVVLGAWTAELARTPGLLALVVVVAVAGFLALLLGDFDWDLVRMIGTMLAGSLFWAVPLLLHHLWGTPGIDHVLDMSDDAVRTAQAHGGPLDVVTLVASPWWGEPQGGTALVRLAAAPWAWFRWALPAAAVLSGVLTWRRRSTRFVAVAVVLLVGLASGANTPFRPVWTFFRDFSDSYDMFRSPMTKFGTLVVLCVAVLVASGVEEGLDRWSRRDQSPADAQLLPVLVGMLVVALVFVHPLFSGEVVAGPHAGTPSARIEIPEGWEDAAAAIDALAGNAAVLVLPLPERSLRGTSWGFWGIDDLVARLSSRTSLQTLPGARAVPRGATTELMTTAEQALANGDTAALAGATRALGVAYLAVRTDVVPDAGPPQRFRDGTELAAAADRMQLRSAGRFDQVELFEVPGGDRFGIATQRIGVLASSPDGTDEATAVAAALLDAGTAIGDLDDVDVGTAWVPTPSQQVLSVGLEPGRYTARAMTRGPALWRATVSGRDVRIVPADRAEVDGNSLLTGTALELGANRAPFALLVGNDPSADAAPTLVPLEGEVTDVQLAAGAPLTLLTLAPSAVDLDGATVRRCERDAAGVGGALPLDDPSSATADGTGVRLEAVGGVVCVAEPVRLPSALDGHRRWVLDLDWSADAGAASWCLYSSATEACLPGSAGRSDGGSDGTVHTVVDAPGDVGDVQLVLRAEPADPSGSATVSFGAVSLSPMQSAGATITVPSPLGRAPTIDVAAGRNVVIDAGGQVGNLAGAIGVSAVDCRAGDPGTAEVRAEPLGEGDDGVRLQADHHAACSTVPITSFPGIREVVLSFEYQTGDDDVAEVRIIDEVAGQTVTSIPLPASSFWTSRTVQLRLPPAPVGRDDILAVELVANGPSAGSDAHVVDASYRRLTLTAVQPFGFAVLPVVEAPAVPPDTPATVRTIDDRFVAVRAAGDVVVTFRQAWDEGWSLHGLPSGATAQHVRIDGWANGWVVSGLDGRTAVLEVQYRGEDLVAFLLWSVPALWLVALLCTDWGRLRRNGKVPHHE